MPYALNHKPSTLFPKLHALQTSLRVLCPMLYALCLTLFLIPKTIAQNHISPGKLHTQSGVTLYQQQKIDSSITCYKRALDINAANGKINYVAANSNDLGVLMYKKGDYDSAIYYYKKSVEYYISVKDSSRASYLFLNIGIAYKEAGDFENALFHVLKSVQLMENLNIKPPLGSSYNTLGNLYLNLRLYDRAKYCHNQALSIHINNQDHKRIAISYNNLGNVFSHQNSIDSALFYYRKSLHYKRMLDNKVSISKTLNNIGELYTKKGDYNNAIKNFEESLAIKRRNSDYLGQLITITALGNLCIQSKNHQKSSKYLLAGDTVIGFVNSLHEQKDYLKFKIDFFKATGQLKEALIISGIYDNLKDSILNEEMTENLAEMQIKYEAEKKEKEIDFLQQDRQLNVATLMQRESNIRTLTISVILTLFIALFLFHNGLVTKQKKKNMELHFSELQHRTKNNLQIISSMLSLQAKRISDSKSKAVLNSGRNRVNAMALIQKKLNGKGIKKEFNLNEYLPEIIDHLINTYGFKEKKLKLDMFIDEIKLTEGDAITLGLLVNEVISNSFKHAFHNVRIPYLLISCKKGHDSDEIELRIKDNGPGIPENINFENINSMGLTIINLLMKNLRNRGTIQMDNSNGTTWILKFKVNNPMAEKFKINRWKSLVQPGYVILGR